MRRIARYLANIFYKPLLLKWLLKERSYAYRGIRLRIHPEVFHPGFFFSTKILLKCIDYLSLQNKKFLELGAGSGLISISAAQKGAIVTATDINPVAIDYLEKNREFNKVKMTIIESDLFSKIPRQVFDIVAINPPYYFHPPATLKEYAWFCGKDGEYFQALFNNLSNYTDQNSVILLILCEGSNRAFIQSIAMEHGFEFECVRITNNLIERNYVYQLHAIPDNR